MQRWQFVLLWALMWCVAQAGAAERPRPSLLITRQEVARAKTLIAASPWAAAIQRTVREAAEKGSAVAQGLVYQIEGHRPSADRAKASLLAASSAFKPGGPYHWGVVKFTLDVPAAAKIGATHGLALVIDGPSWKESVFLPIDGVSVSPPLVLRFDAESVRMGAGAKHPVSLLVTNPTGSPVRGRVRIAGLPQIKVEPAKVELPSLWPGATYTCELTLRGGNRSELGELQASACGSTACSGTRPFPSRTAMLPTVPRDGPPRWATWPIAVSGSQVSRASASGSRPRTWFPAAR